MSKLMAKFCNARRESVRGFTLIELILVIIILGVMAVGISGFITLSTQTYLNASNRDEIIGNARFVIERLSRELRNAVPNSIRVFSVGTTQDCIQFTPIYASTVYTNIPVAPKPASQFFNVIPFNNNQNNPYQCDAGCVALATVYPLGDTDIYDDPNTASGKIFTIDSVDDNTTPWQINLSQAVTVTEHSPTQRLYITKEQVSYCVSDGFIERSTGNISQVENAIPALQSAFMAGYLDPDSGNPFRFNAATLERNAVVQIHLTFTNEGERYVFDHEVHIKNVP